MASADDTNVHGRGRLPVVAILIGAPLMTLVGGVLAASSGPSSEPACTSATGCVFMLDKGRFETIVFPFPADPEESLVGTNNRGLIVGGYIDAEGPHGYFRDRRGRFATIHVPGAVPTQALGINNRGRIVGFYATPDTAPNGQRSPMQMPTMMSGG
jgi:hypothetical protein